MKRHFRIVFCFLLVAAAGCIGKEENKPESVQLQITDESEEKEEVILTNGEETIEGMEEESIAEADSEENVDENLENSVQENQQVWWMEEPDCIINADAERPFKPASEEQQPESGVEYVQAQAPFNDRDEVLSYVGDIFGEIGGNPEAAEKYIDVLTKESLELIQVTDWDSMNQEEKYKVNRVWLDGNMNGDCCSGIVTVELLGSRPYVEEGKEIYYNILWFWNIAYDCETETGIIHIRAGYLNEFQG